ncbi:MAG: DUF202 domain-containing protein [Gordonia sp. (in: high G+C Gram-positive bacteria)]|uniref:YidH family protein n=1 Tax=Gordonia TaxID=2053 RepID=UPI003263FCB5
MARRWPEWVYEEGEEPDPRFSLANERTLLAGLRTALAFMAAGVALHIATASTGERIWSYIAMGLVVIGLVQAGVAFPRWARSERALRTGRPLPPASSAFILVIGLLVAGVVVLIGVALA